MKHKIKLPTLVIIVGNLLCPILFLILSQTLSGEHYLSIIIENAVALSTLSSVTSNTLVELMPIFFKTGILLFVIQLFNELILKGGDYSKSGFQNFIFNISMLLPTVVISILVSLFLNIPFIDNAIKYICDISNGWTSFLNIFSSKTFLIGLQNIILTIWGIIRLAIFLAVAIYPIFETVIILIAILISAILIFIISFITWIFGCEFNTIFNGILNGINTVGAFCERFGIVFGAIAIIVCFIAIDSAFRAVFKIFNFEDYCPQFRLVSRITDAILG